METKINIAEIIIKNHEELRKAILEINQRSECFKSDVVFLDPEIINKTFEKLVSKDFIGIQPLAGPTGVIYGMVKDKNNNLGIINEAVSVENNISNISLGNGTLIAELKKLHGIDPINEFYEIISSELSNEIDKKILYFLNFNIPTTVLYFNSYNDKSEILDDIYSFISQDTMFRLPNWMIVSQEMFKFLDNNLPKNMQIKHDLVPSKGNVIKVGTLIIDDNKLNLYIDRLSSRDYILTGYKEEPDLLTGLVYSPYTMAVSPVVLNKDTGKIERFIILQHKITLLNPSYYAQFKIEGFPEKTTKL